MERLHLNGAFCTQNGRLKVEASLGRACLPSSKEDTKGIKSCLCIGALLPVTGNEYCSNILRKNLCHTAHGNFARSTEGKCQD